ncbi:MAG: glycosyltransferase family 8 protein [Puniceicoccales bacterium]|jgi:lipopolysaccharide biosynthesis glycosyltransferase|nr:glycosyltransferase family 8 protein [Puniceicoccales bacterium]
MAVDGGVINIVFCCDDRFAGPLQVAALSAVLNTLSKIAIYVVDCGISQESQNALCTLKAKYGNVVDVIFRKPIREKFFEKFPMPAHFSSAVFYRLAIARTFPELERAIYMDCDVIVADDIGSLWHVDLGEHPFGAMHDEGNFFSSADMARRKARVGIPPECAYASSGVLLIDCRRFEQAKIYERVLQFIGERSEPLPCPEQEAMMLCLAPDEHLPIDPKFNFTPFSPLARRCLKKIKRPVIIHYSCYKPWVFNRKLVNWLYDFWLFRYSLWFIREYWMYSDQVDRFAFSSVSTKPTWHFAYKRIFGGIEHFIAKRIRNGLVRLWKNMRRGSRK